MTPASLKRSGDFRRVYGEGRRTRRDGIGIAILDRNDTEPPRVGYAVKTSAGPAVTRNRIKRRLRAAVGSCDLRDGVDVVLSGSAEVASMDFQKLVEYLKRGLVALGGTR